MSQLHTHVFRRLSCLTTALTVAGLLSGCGTLTGLDASDEFSCPMTPGTHCRSLSDTYADSLAGRTPDQLAKGRAADTRAATEGIARDTALPSAVSSLEAPSSGSTGPGVQSTDATVNPKASRSPARSAVRPASHAPARLPEVIVTIWIAPWTDDEGDFHEGERIHARAFDARWAAARRRADNASQRRAVVQLPFGSLAASHASAADRPAPLTPEARNTGSTSVDTPFGAGASAFREAGDAALKGSQFVQARFAEAGTDNGADHRAGDRTVEAPVGGTDNLKVERLAGDPS